MNNNENNNENKNEMTAKQNFMQALKFGLFSISAGAIELISFTLMTEFTSMPYWPRYLIALILSVLYNFTLNRRFTFKSANNVPVAMLKVAAFYLVFTPLSTWAGNVLTAMEWNEYLVLIITMVSNLILEYLFCRFVVYRGSMNTRQDTKK